MGAILGATGIPAEFQPSQEWLFLSRGHLPTEGPYADSLNKIIDFLIGRQNREGLYTGGQYGSGSHVWSQYRYTFFIRGFWDGGSGSPKEN